MSTGNKLRLVLTALIVALLIYGSYALNENFGESEHGKRDEYDEKREQFNQEIDRLQEAIEINRQEYEKKAEVLQGQEKELALLELKAIELNSQIDETNEKIEAKNAEIALKQAEVTEAQNKVDEQLSAIRLRLRSMYKFGKTGYIELLLKSDSLINAMTRLDKIRLLTQHDKDLLLKLRTAKDALVVAKNLLEKEEKALEELKEEQLTQKDELDLTYEQLSAKKAITLSSMDALVRRQEEFKQQQRYWDEQLRKLTVRRNYVGGVMDWPLDYGNNFITSYFGPRTEPIPGVGSDHGAIDIAADTGQPVYSVLDGEVIVSMFEYFGGNFMVVDHGGGITTAYAHLSVRYLTVGDKVKKGQALGEVGSTGIWTTGPHLHFEVRVNGERQDPLKFVNVPK